MGAACFTGNTAPVSMSKRPSAEFKEESPALTGFDQPIQFNQPNQYPNQPASVPQYGGPQKVEVAIPNSFEPKVVKAAEVNQPTHYAPAASNIDDSQKPKIIVSNSSQPKVVNATTTQIAEKKNETKASQPTAASSTEKKAETKPGDNKKKVRLDNTAAFQSDGKIHKPVNYASSTTCDDTLAIWKSMTNNKMASILYKLYNPGEAFSIEGLDDTAINALIEDYASLCDYALDQMAGAQDFKSRVKWQTCFLHSIQATYQSQFGDAAFSKIKAKADVLRKKHPIGDGKPLDSLKGLKELGIPIPEGKKDMKLWDKLEFLRSEKYKQTRQDLEYIARNGEVSTPSEIGAVSDVCKYVQTIKDKFGTDMKNAFKNSDQKQFKSNTKGLGRAVFKMDEYAADKNKTRPSFNYIWDLLRCKAIYQDIEALGKDFKELVAKYEIVQVKDKLKTDLKNMTINIVYDRVIAEIQLVCGEVVGEYSNHKVYEVYRCESIQELHKTILAWGDYSFEDFKPLCGIILPTKLLEPQIYKANVGRGLLPIMKSKGYGVSTREQALLSEDMTGFMSLVPVQVLTCFYDKQNLYGISLQGTSQLIGGAESITKIIKHPGFIQNVTGTYDPNTGIKKLVLHPLKGEKITIGKSGANDKEFDFKIPKHCVVLGFGYQASRKSGINSIFCYFGLIPPYAEGTEEAFLSRGLVCGLPNKCPHCIRQLVWLFGGGPCAKCGQEVPDRAGMAGCFKHLYFVCSDCVYKEKPDLLSLPNTNKVTCNKSHKLEWQYTNKSGRDFACGICQTSFNSKTGSYTCPCGVHVCNSCHNEKKAVPVDVPGQPIFPVVTTDYPCGKCNRPLAWHWHSVFHGYENYGYGCNGCSNQYPASSGGFHCARCNYDVCSKCYNDSGKGDITTMPNFRNRQCSKGYYLTWQFSLPGKWTCTTCKGNFPGGSGCYACPKQNCDGFRECSGCYLSGVSNFTSYDAINIPLVSDDVVDLVTPYGKYKSGSDCQNCGRDLYWIFDRAWAAPPDSETNSYFCNAHREVVSGKSGVFYCVKCDYDLCSGCYKKDKETDLLAIPNLSNTTCGRGTILSWNYDFPKDWRCSNCQESFKGSFGGFACSKKGSACCHDFIICSGCLAGEFPNNPQIVEANKLQLSQNATEFDYFDPEAYAASVLNELVKAGGQAMNEILADPETQAAIKQVQQVGQQLEDLANFMNKLW